VLEMLREEETLSQIAARHKIHPNLLQKWKRTAADGLLVVHKDKRADLDSLAEQLGTKHLSFASADRLKRYLGLAPGNDNTATLILSYDDILRFVTGQGNPARHITVRG